MKKLAPVIALLLGAYGARVAGSPGPDAGWFGCGDRTRTFDQARAGGQLWGKV
jgi:hypothetical protein